MTALLCSPVFVSTASAGAAHLPANIRYATVQQVCAPPAPGSATCFALVRRPVAAASAAKAGALPYTLNDGAAVSGPAGGLTPGELASAYGFEGATGGATQTIAIVDAYDDPKIEADLETFDAHYKLAACTEENGCFEKVGQTGSTKSLPEADTSGWSVEITLDVEAAHSVCPNCKILLVEANDPTYGDLATAVNEAVAKGATEVSNSYGGPELGVHLSEENAYNHPGVVITASTGDDGFYDWDVVDELSEPPSMPNAPASLPSVVAVGGTTLKLNSEGKRSSETVWNNNGPGDVIGASNGPQGASGGGCSKEFAAQLWQQNTPGFAAAGCGTKRLSADVAADANPNTGFDIYDSYSCGSYCTAHGLGEGWVTIGGTSLSAPLVTALYGLAGGSDGIQYPALTLYGHLGDASSLFDVSKGANGFCEGEPEPGCSDAVLGGEPPNRFFGATVECEGTTACNAVAGFDGPSGVGAPASLNAFKPLAPTAAATLPSPVRPGVSASFSASGSSDPYPGGSIASYSWSWGDGTANSSGASPTHTFAVSGEYQVTLTVTDNYGLVSKPSVHTVKVAEETLKEKEEEAAKKKAEEEAAAKKKAEEEAAAKKKSEEEAVATRKREEEIAAAARRHGEELASNLGSSGVAGFHVNAPPVPDAVLASTSLQVSASGVVSVKVSCPAGESTCIGTVSLRTLTAVAGSAKKTILSLASGAFTVPGGQVGTVKLHLSRRARALLTRSHSLRVKVTILAHDPAGATHTTLATALLRAPKAKHGGH